MIAIPIEHHRLRTLAIAIVATLLFVGVVGISSRMANAADATVHVGEHILTVHDGTSETGFITKATTLRDALKQAGIRMDANDMTEPSLDSALVASSYDVNIYRARPVAIHDGASMTRVVTAYRTAEQIAKQAGVPLGEADVATLAASSDPISDGAQEVLTINRATPLTFVFYGKQTASATMAATVGDYLKEKGVTPAADDTLIPAASTPITKGMTIQLWKNGKQTVTVDEPIAFTTRQIRDANQPSGYTNVQTPGVNGAKTVTYEINMRNGVETSRTEVNSVTTLQPVEQVEVIGIKVALPPGSHTDWMAQAGISASDYGYVDYIVGRESGWSPTKYNYGGSGAYGLCQALPASKMASSGGDYMTNPITQLKWCNSYAVSRYGGWANAYTSWLLKNWW